MNINFVAPINGTSYGLTASYLLYHLSSMHKISLFPIGQIQPTYPIFQTTTQIAIKNAQTFDKDAVCLRKFHPHDMALRIGNPTVGFTVFELEKLRDNEIHHLNSVDAIISPTHWQKKVLEEHNIKAELYVAPLGVDEKIFRPIKIDIPNKPFQFVAVGKWEERKNYKTLIKAFDAAFAPYDDVELHILAFSWIQPAVERMQTELPRLLADTAIGYKVKVYPNQFIPPEQLANIYNMCDCGISLSHAEGFNLPLLEMLACGLPVIATNVTGHTEYLKPEHGILIDPIGKVEAFDELFFRDKFGEWYDFSFDQIVESMRTAYNTFRDKDFSNNAKISETFNWEHLAIDISHILKEVKGV